MMFGRTISYAVSNKNNLRIEPHHERRASKAGEEEEEDEDEDTREKRKQRAHHIHRSVRQ